MVEERKRNLKEFMIGSLPTVIYIPNFISDTEQTHLLHHIHESPISKWKSLKNRRLQNWGGVVHEKGLLAQDLPPWLTNITERICEETGLFSSTINHVLINEYFPDQGIMPHQDGPAYFPVVAILSLGSPVAMNFTPHSKLIDSIQTTVYTSTENGGVGEVRVDNKDVIHSNYHHPFSVLLMPCSLLIFKDEAYSDYLHGIKDNSVHCVDEVENLFEALKYQEENPCLLSSENAVETKCTEQIKNIERTTTRVSLTCRSVLKVRKNFFKF